MVRMRLQAYEKAAGMVRSSWCVNSHTLLVLPMLAMGLRLHAEAVRHEDGQQVAHSVGGLAGVSKWGERLAGCSRRRIRWPCGSGRWPWPPSARPARR